MKICQIRFSYGKLFNDNDNEYIKVLIGNKSDLERTISYEEAEEFAQTCDCEYFEVSCKTGENCEVVFDIILTKLYEKFIHPNTSEQTKKSSKKKQKCTIN